MLNINNLCSSVPRFTWLILTADIITPSHLPSLPAHQQHPLWNPRACSGNPAYGTCHCSLAPPMLPASGIHEWLVLWARSCWRTLVTRQRRAARDKKEEVVRMASNSSALPRVTFQTPEKPGEESSHRKLGKLTIKYNRKDLQRWLDLEEWINARLQELYQYPVSSWGKPAPHSLGEWDERLCAGIEACWLSLLEIDPCHRFCC